MAEIPSSANHPRLSVSIIACNNASTITRTLESIALLGDRVEIVIVDSGSTDDTTAIGARFGARVIPHEWEGHIRQKQFALEQCTGAWIFCMDSDESIEPPLAQSIRRVIFDDDNSADAYEINRRVWFGGCELKHVWQPEWRLRLVRTGCAQWAGYDPHDRLELLNPGRTARLQGILRHDAFADADELIRKQIAHARRAAQSYHALGRRGSIIRLVISPTSAFIKQVILRRAFMDGWRGWICAAGAALNGLLKHMYLLELSSRNQQPR